MCVHDLHIFVVTLRHSKGDNSYQPTVWVSTQKLNDKILISVKDNGPGIPPELIGNIFFPMITRRAEGTGLGLAITQNLISQHGGLVECQSEPGKTEFILYLPLDDQYAEA